MANEVFVCMRRADIPCGTLQVLDLEPNESLRNLVYTTPGQTKYLRQPQSDTVVTHAAGADIVTNAEYRGVAAYLIDHVVASGVAPGIGTGAMTAANANTAATNLITRMRNGLAMAVSDVNTVLSAVVANTGLATGGSSGTILGLLAVLSGAEYVVPAGTAVQTGANKNAASGAFDATTYRQLYNTSSFILSNAVGRLATMKLATFDYDGTAAAAVVCYSLAGALL